MGDDSGYEPTMEELHRGLLAVENMHRRTWRFQDWCYAHAERAEPLTDENDRTWPTTLRAKVWSTVGMRVQDYWLWRWVHGRFATPPPTTEEARESDDG